VQSASRNVFEENSLVMEALKKRGNNIVAKAFGDQLRDESARKRPCLEK